MKPTLVGKRKAVPVSRLWSQRRLPFPIERATLKNIKPILNQHIDPATHLVTDDASVYYMMKPEFAKHSTINHSAGKYVRKEADGMKVTTNTVESYISLIKRSVYGIHHSMSR
jgi:hypothetical protein